MKKTWIATLALTWLVSAVTGCATPGLLNQSKNDFPTAGPKHPVTRILGVWEPAMGTGLDGKTSRGFSGQIYFFSQGSDLAAKVDGDVKFFVFDDQGTPEEQAKPIYEDNFEAKAWNQLMAKSPLGATYSVFIPYTRPGNYEAKCTLRIRYKPANGPIVYSDMVNIILEGKKKPVSSDAPVRDYDEAAGSRAKNGKSANGQATQVAFREPPRAYGLAEAISGTNGPAGLRGRRTADGLSEEDRARIIREVRARVDAETKGTVKLVEYEERNSNRAPSANASTARKSWTPKPAPAGRQDDANTGRWPRSRSSS